MTMSALLTIVATPSPDLRTAIATERLTALTGQLSAATWALFAAGFLTLLAASVAAYYAREAALFAKRAYELEATPTLVMTKVLATRPNTQVLPRSILTRDPDPNSIPKPGDLPPPAVLRPILSADASRFADGNPQPQNTFEVRNVGRSPIVDARIELVLHVAEMDRFVQMGDVHDVDYPAQMVIPSIAANETIFIPIVQGLGAGATLEVRSVTEAVPSTGPAIGKDAPRKPVAFLAEPLRFQPM